MVFLLLLLLLLLLFLSSLYSFSLKPFSSSRTDGRSLSAVRIFSCSLFSSALSRARPWPARNEQVAKVNRSPHAYCRVLLIGPDPNGMKYKNRNKASLPVPGMFRFRIRDSYRSPSRANLRRTDERYYSRETPT